MLKGLQKLLRLDLGEAIPAKGLAVDRGTVCFPVGFVDFFPNGGIYSYIFVNGNFTQIFTETPSTEKLQP